jgi:hypothetical protein
MKVKMGKCGKWEAKQRGEVKYLGEKWRQFGIFFRRQSGRIMEVRGGGWGLGDDENGPGRGVIGDALGKGNGTGTSPGLVHQNFFIDMDYGIWMEIGYDGIDDGMGHKKNTLRDKDVDWNWN